MHIYTHIYICIYIQFVYVRVLASTATPAPAKLCRTMAGEGFGLLPDAFLGVAGACYADA